LIGLISLCREFGDLNLFKREKARWCERANNYSTNPSKELIKRRNVCNFDRDGKKMREMLPFAGTVAFALAHRIVLPSDCPFEVVTVKKNGGCIVSGPGIRDKWRRGKGAKEDVSRAKPSFWRDWLFGDVDKKVNRCDTPAQLRGLVRPAVGW